VTTSRTGTAAWKKVRAQILRRAQRNGITHCPNCKVLLDYKVGRQPHSAEADHIVPHSLGGRDTLDNGTVLCRRCNQSKGNRAAPKQTTRSPLKTSRDW
jgi:5-methylcytosine-specific restriction endonuclease McrA